MVTPGTTLKSQKMACNKHSLLFLMTLACVWDCNADQSSLISEVTDIKISSQCFGTNGVPFVSLYCGVGQVIKIQRAFHGMRKNSATSKICMYEEGDCFRDQRDTYEWAANCEGRHRCSQLLKRALMPTCKQEDGVSYLQVEYSCIKGEVTTTTVAPPTTTTTMRPKNPSTTKSKKKPKKLGRVINICKNQTLTVKKLTITSPDFPSAVLSSNQDCYCNMIGMGNNHVIIQLQDISLGMHDSLCHDWLAVTYPNNVGSKVVACGGVKDVGKQVVSPRDKVSLHYHTAKGQHPPSLHGFSVHIEVENGADLKIRCQAVPINKAGTSKSLVLPLTDLKQLPDRHSNDDQSTTDANYASSSLSTSNKTVIYLLIIMTLFHSGNIF